MKRFRSRVRAASEQSQNADVEKHGSGGSTAEDPDRPAPVSPSASPRQALLSSDAVEENLAPLPPAALESPLLDNGHQHGVTVQFAPPSPGASTGAGTGHPTEHANLETQQSIGHGVYWRSPFVMVSTLVLGTVACLVHHFFYSSLRGLPAEAADQQRYLRYGNTLAWLAQLLLTTSVWMVYNQWLWLSLVKGNGRASNGPLRAGEASASNNHSPGGHDQFAAHSNTIRAVTETPDDAGDTQASGSNTTSLRVLDIATSVQSSFISLLHVWLFKNLKVAYCIAILAWCLQIPSLVTPSTLVVVASLNVTDIQNVPVLDINNAMLNSSFAYDTPMEANEPPDAPDLKFVGVRSVVETIGVAAATSGRIQDMDAPLNDSSYQAYWLQFSAPYVACQDANPFQTQVINATVNKTMEIHEATYFEAINAFSAFIPIYGGLFDDLDENATTTVVVKGQEMTALWAADLQRPLNSSTNELWMRFYRYQKDSSGNYLTGPDGQYLPPNLHFLTCQLYNATYNVSFTWNNGVQNITDNTVVPGAAVPYPNDVAGRPSDVIDQAYSALFLVVAAELVGSMAFYNNTVNSSDYAEEPPNFSSFSTRILETSLTGSDDLDYFFAVNKLLYANNSGYPLSPQRLQDKAVARNQTLDALIAELSFNITVSLLHDPLLARLTPATVTHARDGNQYDYAWPSLVTAYGLAVAATLVANLLGALAYVRNGGAFDHAFSTNVSVTRGRELDDLFPRCCYGVQPLPPDSLDAPLRVEVTGRGRRKRSTHGGGSGSSERPGRVIVLAGKVRPVCIACNPPRPQPPRPSLAERMRARRRSSADTGGGRRRSSADTAAGRRRSSAAAAAAVSPHLGPMASPRLGPMTSPRLGLMASPVLLPAIEADAESPLGGRSPRSSPLIPPDRPAAS